jgi:cob(I)alamin adenosyltransferase
MKIYTKTGDHGTTALFGGKRVSKADLRVDAYGTVDELNSYLGLLFEEDLIVHIQDRLFTLGAMLATEPGNTKVKVPQLTEDDITVLEKGIDKMEEILEPMKHFILPGGHPTVSFCHIARTVCRRAERLAVALNSVEPIDPLIIKYLNRLSDYLFVLSRLLSKKLGAKEIPWLPKMS